MRWLYVILFFALMVLFQGNATAGDNPPSWVNHPPSEDGGNYNVYVGRAAHAPSQVEANFQATVDARKQAIASNFGLAVNFNSQTYQALGAESSTQVAQEASGKVILLGFEQQDTYFEPNKDGTVSAWILFHYSKAEIHKERVRLDRIRAKQGDDFFKMTEVGSETNPGQNGTILVHSHPEGLPVKLDGYDDNLGEKLLTPITIHGVAQGHHIIDIDSPKYALHEEEVDLLPGTTAQVDAIMKPALATLQIKTVPDGATVMIGSLIFKSPTTSISVPAGTTIPIQISHPEAKKTIQDKITLNRRDDITKDYTLDLKPVLVSIDSSPEGAEIYDGDQKTGKTAPAVLHLSARQVHHITLSKGGFDDYEVDVPSLPGGSTYFVNDKNPVVLNREKTPKAVAVDETNDSEDPSDFKTDPLGVQRELASNEPTESTPATSDSDVTTRLNPPWLYALDIMKFEWRSNESDLSFFNFAVEKHFGLFGARLGLGLLGGSENNQCQSNPSNPQDSHCLKWFSNGTAALPAYLLIWRSGSYLALVPEFEGLRGQVVDNRVGGFLEWSGPMLIKAGVNQSLNNGQTHFMIGFGCSGSGL